MTRHPRNECPGPPDMTRRCADADPQRNAAMRGSGELCGLPIALEAMGERWSFMILKAAFHGTLYFDDVVASTGISRNILSNRLARLVEFGVLSRGVDQKDRRRIPYRLTEKGLDLLPAILALRQWGNKYGKGVPSDPLVLDRRDHRPIQPIKVKAHDGRVLCWSDLKWVDRTGV